MISVRIQGKPFNITVIQVYAPTSNAEEAEVEWFYEDLQDLLELTPKKVVLIIIGDWNAKLGSKETPRVTRRFGLGVQNEVGQRLNSTHGHHQMVNTEIRLIIFSAAKEGEALYSQQKQEQEMTVAQISSVQFSRSVVSNSLRHHEPQHTRPPCPSPTPGVYSNSRPSSR